MDFYESRLLEASIKFSTAVLAPCTLQKSNKKKQTLVYCAYKMIPNQTYELLAQLRTR